MIATPLGIIRDVIGADCVFDGDQGAPMVSGVSTDSRSVAVGDLFIAIRGERFDGHAFVGDALRAGACAAVVDAQGAAQLHAGGEIGSLLIVDETIAALGRLAKWHRTRAKATVIAVTGSCGKTTTKNMIAHVLGDRFRTVAAAASFNNQIGVPLTLLRCGEEDEIVVVEIGTNSPGEVAALAAIASPDIGVVTSVGMAHLERLGDLDGVRREKLSLFSHTRSVGIVHDGAADAPDLEGFGLGRLIRFGESLDADVRVCDVVSDLDGAVARVIIGSCAGDATGHPDGGAVDLRIAVAGRHNVLNAVAAVAVAHQVGVPVEDAVGLLSSFSPPSMRMHVERVGDVTLIRDCYNANPTSMRAAIDVLASAVGRRVLVAGRMAELGANSAGQHRDVGAYAMQCGVDVIVAVGSEAGQVLVGVGAPCPGGHGADRVEDTVGQVDSGTRCGIDREEDTVGQADSGTRNGPLVFEYADLESAGEGLIGLLLPGDVVLFKGSRVAGLERIADFVAKELSRGVFVT